MSISQDRFIRVLLRCAEVAKQAGIDPVISNVYSEALAGPADAYLAVDADASTALIACEQKKREAIRALKSLNSPYKVARSALTAILPETLNAVPDTLKSLPTDTDRVKAIQWLVNEIQKRAGKGWADALISGEFSVKAAATLKAINEATAASNELTTVRMDRAAAYEPAYEKYLAFKQVVRDALGPNSREYRRIHLRALPKGADEEPEDAPTEGKGAEPEAALDGEAKAAPETAPVPSVAPAEPIEAAAP